MPAPERIWLHHDHGATIALGGRHLPIGHSGEPVEYVRRDLFEAVVELLREASTEYADHASWRCAHPPHYYLTEAPLSGDCPCGYDDFVRRVDALT